MNNPILTMTIPELQSSLNDVKDLLFRTMEKDGLIENAEALSMLYVISARQKGWFGKAFDKVFGAHENPNAITYTILYTSPCTPEKK